MRNRLILIAFLLIAAFPIHKQYHNYKEMHVWGRSVVRLLGGHGGGTGFQLKWGGKQYTVTNDHVCSLADQDGVMLADSQYVAIQGIRVLARSPYTDLCLLQPVQGLPALELGDREFKFLEDLTVLGHPRLRPLEARHGSARQTHDVDVMLGIIDSPASRAACTLPKHRIELIFFDMFEACVMRVRAQETTALIEPGNSGSPVLDHSGHVKGVAFASGSNKKAAIVPFKDLLKFLQSYSHSLTVKVR